MPLSMRHAIIAFGLSLSQVATAAFADGLADANARIDRALAQVEGCQTLFDVAMADRSSLEIVLEAACRGSQTVTLDHGGMTLHLTTSPAGRLFARIPMLDADAPVTLAFADGRMAEQMPPVAELRPAEADVARR